LAQHAAAAREFEIADPYPILSDRRAESGAARGHYFHQDLLVAQHIFRAQPRRHIDVGSRVDGFVAHVASFRSVQVLDIRALSTVADNLEFVQHDIMQSSPDLVESSDSISSLHALEHFGLGRYGDRVDYEGHVKGFANIVSMLVPGGLFYMSVPISCDQRIEFDAQRVFALPYLKCKLFSGSVHVEEFSYVDDAGDLHRAVDLEGEAADRSFDLRYGCGIFTLRKLERS
jgi:hypothetical protein